MVSPEMKKLLAENGFSSEPYYKNRSVFEPDSKQTKKKPYRASHKFREIFGLDLARACVKTFKANGSK